MQRPPVLDRPHTTVDDRQLRCDIHYPPGAGPFPALLWISGGGWQRMGRRGAWELAGWVLDAGVALIPIDYRVAPQVRHPVPADDCRSALRQLRSEAAALHLDPRRLGVWGDSAGGHLACLLGAAASGVERPDLVIAFMAPTDLTRHVTPFRAEAGALLGIDPWCDRVRARSASPVHQLRAAAPPHLLVHGGDDRMVPVVQSRLHLAALQSLGIPAELAVVPGAGHDSPRLYGDLGARHRVRLFVRRHFAIPLPGVAGALPASPTDPEP